MKQFLLKAPPDRDGLVRISGEDFHYLVHVRRLKAGDRFTARLPQGALKVEVRSVEDGILTAAVMGGAADGQAGDCSGPEGGTEGRGLAGDRGVPPILLFQALPKGSKMDLIVRQAAEGALSEVVPFAAERSVPALGGQGGGEKVRRWERIIREALQQSGSPVPTALHRPLDGDGLFAYWEELKAAHPGALGILFHQEDVPLVQSNLHGYLSTGPELLALAVGPEGGFSPAEVGRFISAGFRPYKMGAAVLRVETAALYGAAAARIILLEGESWIQRPR
ncbi:MAG: 16S rRNA (uracil(1498)-N(3))-methyltransferase [Treponema sp.]|nr:16S rRNA (uracil(1498)-N(3))-methyltransferase [Treponema sp.]